MSILIKRIGNSLFVRLAITLDFYAVNSPSLKTSLLSFWLCHSVYFMFCSVNFICLIKFSILLYQDISKYWNKCYADKMTAQMVPKRYVLWISVIRKHYFLVCRFCRIRRWFGIHIVSGYRFRWLFVGYGSKPGAYQHQPIYNSRALCTLMSDLIRYGQQQQQCGSWRNIMTN